MITVKQARKRVRPEYTGRCSRCTSTFEATREDLRIIEKEITKTDCLVCSNPKCVNWIQIVQSDFVDIETPNFKDTPYPLQAIFRPPHHLLRGDRPCP